MKIQRAIWVCLILGLVWAVIYVVRPRSPHEYGKRVERTLDELVICANPDYYDYLHYMELSADGNVKLTAGAGQVIHFEAKGKYKLDLTNGALELFDLGEIDPYKDKEIGPLPARTNRFERETGVFAMQQETPFRPKTPDDEPVVIFSERYLFESDPLVFARENAKANLYYMTETRDLNASECIYYPDDHRERITLGEAKRRGLKLLSKAEQLGAITSSTNRSAK